MEISSSENLEVAPSQVGPFDSTFDSTFGVLLQDSVCIPTYEDTTSQAHHRELIYLSLSPSESPPLHGSLRSSYVSEGSL